MNNWKLITKRSGSYREGVESFLTRRIPYLISQNTVLETALLRQEGSTNRGFLVGLEFVRNLIHRVSDETGET